MIKRITIIGFTVLLALSITSCGTKTGGQTQASAVSSPIPTETPKPEDIGTGYTTIHEGGRKIDSNEIVSFSLAYDLLGFYEEDNERSDICLSGRYTIEMQADEKGDVVCSLKYRDIDGYNDPVEVQFTAGPEAFAELQQVLTDAGIIAINGFSGWDSALGTYVNLKAEYATGEKLSVYGEGGASAYPPADIDAVIVFFNELAEKNGLRFTHYPGKTELTALFKEWLEEILPAAVNLEEVEWNYEEFDHFADLDAGFYDPGATDWQWNAYARYDRMSSERIEGYYYYAGISEKDEMMNRFLAWIRENCPGAEVREGEVIQTTVNFKGLTDSVQLIASDSEGSELWEAYAVFDRTGKAVFDINYYGVTAEGEAEENVSVERLQFND